MFAKPFNLILVYILSIFNFIILLLPILALALPFIDFEGGKIVTSSKVIYSLQNVLILLIFIVSFLMLIYLILDMIFGFSHRSSLAGCKRYDKLKTYEF
ncbi:MAG: hypothetical protein O3B09_02870, partial [Proteobacteria bacterium]|nr:hypothetical protein [Pseudomonadota bacterium]